MLMRIKGLSYSGGRVHFLTKRLANSAGITYITLPCHPAHLKVDYACPSCTLFTSNVNNNMRTQARSMRVPQLSAYTSAR